MFSELLSFKRSLCKVTKNYLLNDYLGFNYRLFSVADYNHLKN